MTVKGNQENLCFAIADRLRHLSASEGATVRTEDRGHGRIEYRTLVVVSLPEGKDLGWPEARQIGSIRRVRVEKRTGEVISQEISYFVTCLTSAQASSVEFMHLARGHWTIENKVHYVRDVTLVEDASQLRKGTAPRVMVTFRNLVLTLL